MQLKIFAAGFTAEDFNAFGEENIVYKYQFNADGAGACYVFYKPKTEIGNTPIEDIEELDRLVKQAQKEIFSSELDKATAEQELADVSEKISQTQPNYKKEWDGLQARRKMLENQIIMSNATIETRTQQVGVLKDAHREILSPTPVEPAAPVEPVKE